MIETKEKDYIYSRLNNELKQIEEQKRLINEKKLHSQENWVVEALKNLGDFFGNIAAIPFKIIADLIKWLFG